MDFKLTSKHKPAGDQPQAIAGLVSGIKKEDHEQVLLGVTGSGKTFTVANVIAETKLPTLVISHNKTLAAQLTNEFRELFPKNAVDYFVSYYDYYQPEAYLPGSDTYIEKEAMINDEIDRLRHSATQDVLTRKDVIVCASVSCIYGLGTPSAYLGSAMKITKGQTITRADILKSLVGMHYVRTNADLIRGQFRVSGETIEIMPVSQSVFYRIRTSAGTVTEIYIIDPITRKILEEVNEAVIFPGKHFVTKPNELESALTAIRAELNERIKVFEKQGKLLEAERLDRRTRFDLEMMKEIGFCHGIENYSRPLSHRPAGSPPETLVDYFRQAYGNDWLLVIDESHVTMPQISGMYEGDRARKNNLIEYGFRLPSAADNRPLRFNEFETMMPKTIYVSATPAAFEIKRADAVHEQIIRPTGLLDPEIVISPVTATPTGGVGQVEDLISRIPAIIKRKERVMVTTLTKKMAEDLTEYLAEKKIKTVYLHSDIETLDRIRILTEYRKGTFDVLVGVNLLREGLDLPEVSLIAILDADKEGFLRSETSLIQTIGRAARNVRGKVILYADRQTQAIKNAIRETERRRKLQFEYNTKHGITPKTIKKKIKDITEEIAGDRELASAAKTLAIENSVSGKTTEELIREKELAMREAAKNLEFELAAIIRDEIKVLKGKKLK